MPTPDYDALAKQFGATSSTPASSAAPVDYDALAKQNGAISSTAPAAAAQPSMLQRAWNWFANTPVLDNVLPKDVRTSDILKASLFEHMTGEPYIPGVNDFETMKQFHQGESPLKVGTRAFVAGAASDLADTAASFTTPLSVGTIALAPAAKALQAGAKTVPALATAAKVVKGVNTAAAAGFAAKGAADVVENAPKAIEGDPDAVRAALQGASMVAGGAAAGSDAASALRHPISTAGDVVRDIYPNSPLGDTLTKPRGTTPAESASPAELKAYADANGIRVNAAQLTEHNFPRNLQSAGERATVGGTAIKQQIATAQADVANHVNKLMDTMSPATDAGSAGAALQDSVSNALEKQQEISDGLYERAQSLADMTRTKVDLKPLKDAAQEILNDSHFIRERLSTASPKRATNLVQEVADLPVRGDWKQAADVRSKLLDEARHPDNVLSDEAQGWIKRLSGVNDEQMSKAASSDPDLLNAWRSANAHYKAIQEDFNSPRSPLNQILQEPNPDLVSQKLTGKGNIGGSPFRVGLLDKYGIDKGPIQRMVLQDMLNKDFRMHSGKTLSGYSDTFLRSLYSPDQVDAIYKTGALARSVNMQANPSGTAVVKGAMEDVQKPVRSALPKGVAAMLTNSKNFNDWLLRVPAKDAATMPARQFFAGFAARQKEQE